MTDQTFCLGIAPLFTDNAKLWAEGADKGADVPGDPFPGEGWVIRNDDDGEDYGRGDTEALAWADCRRRYEERRAGILALAERLRAFAPATPDSP